eukprot:m.143380 g.143380  ORF g.143380 m.143380 type:complete len:951 (-) comp13206_c0_seq2:215-3067(-)
MAKRLELVVTGHNDSWETVCEKWDNYLLLCSSNTFSYSFNPIQFLFFFFVVVDIYQVMDFPRSHAVLWSRKPMGTSAVLQLSSPTAYVSNTTLQIVARAADAIERDLGSNGTHHTNSLSQLNGFLSGEMTVNATNSCFEFAVKRFDKGRQLQDGEVIPVIPVVGQYAIPIKMATDSIRSVHQQLQAKFVEDLKESILFSDVNMPMEVRVTLVVDGGDVISRDMAQFLWISLVPAVKFKCVPIVPVRVVKTALFRRLSLVSSPRTEFETGYLTMNQSRHCIFVLEEDVAVKSTQLIGIYVSGAVSLNDPRIVLACLRYIKALHLKHRVFIDDTHFLLCFHVNRNGVAYTDWYEVSALADCVTQTDCVQVQHETTIKTTEEQRGRVQLLFQSAPQISSSYRSNPGESSVNEPYSVYSSVLGERRSKETYTHNVVEEGEEEEDSEPVYKLPQPHTNKSVSSNISAVTEDRSLDLSFSHTSQSTTIAAKETTTNDRKKDKTIMENGQGKDTKVSVMPSSQSHLQTSTSSPTSIHAPFSTNSTTSSFASALQQPSNVTIESIHEQLVWLQEQFRSLTASQQSMQQVFMDKQHQHAQTMNSKYMQEADADQQKPTQPQSEHTGVANDMSPSNEMRLHANLTESRVKTSPLRFQQHHEVPTDINQGGCTIIQAALSELIQGDKPQMNRKVHTRQSSKASSSMEEVMFHAKDDQRPIASPQDGRQCDPHTCKLLSSPKVFETAALKVKRSKHIGRVVNNESDDSNNRGTTHTKPQVSTFHGHRGSHKNTTNSWQVWDDCESTMAADEEKTVTDVKGSSSADTNRFKPKPPSFQITAGIKAKAQFPNRVHVPSVVDMVPALKVNAPMQQMQYLQHREQQKRASESSSFYNVARSGQQQSVRKHPNHHYNSSNKAARRFGEVASNTMPKAINPQQDLHMKAQQITARYLSSKQGGNRNEI